MMTCTEAKQLVYQSGMLDEGDPRFDDPEYDRKVRNAERHIDGCSFCQGGIKNLALQMLETLKRDNS